MRDTFRARGYQSDFEAEVLSGVGDRRADVLITNSRGKRVAIEVQHTSILYDAMERRTESYIEADVPVIWIGILSSKMKEDAAIVDGGLEIEQYVIKPWEKWAHAYYYKELWYIDPHERTLWRGQFTDFMIYVESTSWFNEYGEEQSAGGFSKHSKKWKTLRLSGPVPLDSVTIKIEPKPRRAWSSKTFSLPAGRYAHFVDAEPSSA